MSITAKEAIKSANKPATFVPTRAWLEAEIGKDGVRDLAQMVEDQGGEPLDHSLSIADKVADADMRGGQWLAKGNAYAEAGKPAQAEKCYEKGQFWLDRSNKLRGCC